MRAARLLCLLLAMVAPVAVASEVRIDAAQPLRAHWFAGEGTAARPAVVALHGCGGLYADRAAATLAERYVETARRLNAAGYAVLMPDSFGSRGLRDICQTRYDERAIKPAQRAQDAQAALAWLARQPQVDARRMAVLGWSNGASTALSLLEQRSQGRIDSQPALAGVALFYPGCEPQRRRQADLGTAPLLLQLGALDDWTPPEPCEALAAQQRERGRSVELHVHEGSYHGFDGTAPVRFRPDVPNGSSGLGVHQGGNPAARAKALVTLDAFLARVLALPAATAPSAPASTADTVRPGIVVSPGV